jgi:serine phosphatase RsbU (regulator of sigma subunit)
VTVSYESSGPQAAGGRQVVWRGAAGPVDTPADAGTDDIGRLCESELRIAATAVQEYFLHPLPAIDGLELAAFSAVAGRGALVGGDFHDVFQLPSGLVVAGIGDVMGKGIMAAGLIETVRSAVRALSYASRSPIETLKYTNLMLLHQGPEQPLVTALLVVLDPHTGRGLVASAGHPPAAHVAAPGGSCRLVEVPYGLPLGSMEQSFRATDFWLNPGDALVLYTDGATEARCKGELFGEERLIEALATTDDLRPAALVDRVGGAVTSFARDLCDDLQIVALRRVP